VNYSIGNSFKYKKSKMVLFIGILFNLLLLGYFKYMDFFIKNINDIFDENIALLHLALPLAISFFTFQQIAYLVDSYKGETEEYDFLNYTLFITFFPQLIAGPIVHHKEMMPQFASKKNSFINFKHISLGLFIFSIGLFKKLVIADSLAIWVNYGYSNLVDLNTIEAWIVSFSYTFQLYFDFSGYTDMAIGSALLFNIKLPTNFNSPYKALSIQDFWRRWHMTLSKFLRDYIYIPLGGNKKGNIRLYFNLLITFLIGGMWHGAGWTFIIWGALHGIALIVHRIWLQLNIKMYSFLAFFLTFNFINITWVFFRAKDVSDAIYMLNKMFVFDNKAINFTSILEFGVVQQIDGLQILFIFCLSTVLIFVKNTNELLQNFKVSRFYIMSTALLFTFAFLFLNKNSTFLYFNF
jgi:D-alanyl-lipoteichoic acid acyltransferase DltB (MBOAT superfamily)